MGMGGDGSPSPGSGRGVDRTSVRVTPGLPATATTTATGSQCCALPASRERSMTRTGHGHVTGRWLRSCPRPAPGPRAALLPAPSLESSRLAAAGVKVQAGCSGRLAHAGDACPADGEADLPCRLPPGGCGPEAQRSPGGRGWARAWLGVSLASRRPPLPAVGPPGGAEPPAASVQPAFAWAAETTWPLPGVAAQIHLRQPPGSFPVHCITSNPPREGAILGSGQKDGEVEAPEACACGRGVPRGPRSDLLYEAQRP